MTDTKKNNNKTIAKNTFVLYLRMMLMMLVGLYTSRIVLETLGVEDFGIYNVVGGVVALFGLLSNSMCNAIGRFLTIELGKNDKVQLRRVFSTSINVLLLIAFGIMLLAEIIGVWYIYYKMNMPVGRQNAAMWAYQSSLFSFLFTMISIPYTAIIIAHEKMTAFAYMSIVEVLLKLVIVFLLMFFPFDKLKLYAVLMFVVSVVMRIMYRFYCKKHFEEANYLWTKDKGLLKGMFSFASWNFIDYGAYILNQYGLDIVVNLFFGVTINAARGIASQVNGTVNKFVQNFMSALNPQIYKTYAREDYKSMHLLIVRGAKFSYFLMLFMIIPICLETKEILSLWLVNVPQYAVEFIRWTLIISILSTLSNTLITALYATARLKKYMLIVGLIDILNLPITYLVLRTIDYPIVVYYVWFANSFILAILRLALIHKQIKMSLLFYVKKVYFRVFLVTILAVIFPMWISMTQEDSLIRFIEVCLVSFISTLFFVFICGLNKNERMGLIRKIKRK